MGCKMPEDKEQKIRELQRKLDKNRERNKRSEDKDAFQRVFDARTIGTLVKLLNNGIITEIIGIISQGKEANVYFAYGEHHHPIALKIYKIDIQSAKWMKNYIKGDPRFKKTGTSPDKIVFTWCQKEFRNLTQITKAEIPCPHPIYFRNNVLVMDFIGDSNGNPATKLKDSITLLKNPEKESEKSLRYISELYIKAKLVHADLSEYNILYYKNIQYLIDVSQAVSRSHPKAKQYLARDIRNIINFYTNLGVITPDPLEVYKNIIE
jgi:RIO kinase 1